jgi:hypothetical protein
LLVAISPRDPHQWLWDVQSNASVPKLLDRSWYVKDSIMSRTLADRAKGASIGRTVLWLQTSKNRVAEAAPFGQTDHNTDVSAIKFHRVVLDTLHASRAQVRSGAQKLTTTEARWE